MSLFGFIPDPDYPTYPFHPESIYTIAAKLIIEDGKIKETRFIPMIVNKEGVTEVVGNDERGKLVMEYMEKITRGAGLNGKFVWDGDEILIKA